VKCSKCGFEGEAGVHFYVRSGGRPIAQCKECVKAAVRARNAPVVAENQNKRQQELQARSALTHKTCVKCGCTKSLDQFYEAKRGLLGRRSDCIECNIAKARRWAVSNPEKVKQIAARKPRDGMHHRVARRQTPRWADRQKIREVYARAENLGHHVDHIYPLRGKLCCGLHVHHNLQTLPPEENQRKFNRMPEEMGYA